MGFEGMFFYVNAGSHFKLFIFSLQRSFLPFYGFNNKLSAKFYKIFILNSVWVHIGKSSLYFLDSHIN